MGNCPRLIASQLGGGKENERERWRGHRMRRQIS
jgi:hypothetical protein